MKVQTIANVFLKLSQPELGDGLTNLKLQKLVYYAQGFSLAVNDHPLFAEDIVAWEHGPVVRELYAIYRELGSGTIPVPDVALNIDKDDLALIEEVNNVYGQFSAWKLRDMTHQERPWVETPRDQVISHELMKEYFSTLTT